MNPDVPPVISRKTHVVEIDSGRWVMTPELAVQFACRIIIASEIPVSEVLAILKYESAK